MRTPIVGQASELRSPNASANRLVNLYVEMSPDGKTAVFLTRSPGLKFLVEVGQGPIRGVYQFGGAGYVVSGTELYQVSFLDYTATKIDDVTGTGMVSFADNGIQLFIACDPDGFIYNKDTEDFAEITDTDFPGAVTVGYIDGFFVFNEPDSQKVWTTSLLDGTAVDPLDFASAEGSPDLLVGLSVVHREVWLFGSESIEIWYNAGESGFPLARISGAFIEIGCVASKSIAKLDNTIYWLGADKSGGGAIYRAEGYSAKKVSNTAFDVAVQQYGTISDATAYAYQQEGHSFYVIVFPTEGKTWAYDVATGVMAERSSMINGEMLQHKANCLSVWNRNLVVGDFRTGNLYTLDLGVYDDNGEPQKWVRRWRAIPPDKNNLKRAIHYKLQVDIEAGVGLNGLGQGSDPEVMLRWSDDGGNTWGNIHRKKIGRIGQYRNRAIWRQLGISRDRVYELSGTDPVKITIMGAELDLMGCNS